MAMTYRKRWGFRPNPAVAAEIASLDARADCQRIAHLLTAYEFSWDVTRALEVALFFTYGSNTVSRLLDRTGEFREHGQKRYDDTRLLIAHFMDTGWDGDIGRRAIARMNQSHAHYRIPNDDFLFVLWTFIDFPIRWADDFAWRPMTLHEQTAWFHFWVGIGERMGLKDIPATRGDFDAFVHAYRQRHFVPDAASANVARATLAIMEGWLPAPLRPLVAPIVFSLMDDAQFLAAIDARPSPAWLRTGVRGGLKLLGRAKRLWAIGAYPMVADAAINRTYPGNRYTVEQLAPDRLREAEKVKRLRVVG